WHCHLVNPPDVVSRDAQALTASEPCSNLSRRTVTSVGVRREDLTHIGPNAADERSGPERDETFGREACAVDEAVDLAIRRTSVLVDPTSSHRDDAAGHPGPRF